ncbi:MAG: D-alanine--poly(phosphoribitol) ligase subunit DltC [Terrimicrobiaceae bacterium]|nr:D-alanine--poly(phosphoribitol) ligase subunit DltC [Terrimicrobiaceae bacterium]
MCDVEGTVLGLLEEIVQTDEVRRNPSLPLFDSGLLDSIGIVRLLAGVSQQCGVDVPLTDFDAAAWDTPQHIVENVRSRL